MTTLLRATPNGQWKFFETLFKQAFPPAQPDLFLAEEIARLGDPPEHLKYRALSGIVPREIVLLGDTDTEE